MREDKGVNMKRMVFFWAVLLSLNFFPADSFCFAAEIEPVICLTKEKKFVYYADAAQSRQVDAVSLDTFAGMAPGDTRTQILHLKNESDHEVRFFVTQKTLDTLEADNRAAGGAYRFRFLVGTDKSDAVSLLDTRTGGYDTDGNGSREGLGEIRQLEDYTFLAKVEAGGSVNLFIELKLEGEGNDNRTGNDYSDTVAHLSLGFRAYDAAKKITYGEDTEVVKREKSGIITGKTRNVKTGDESPYGAAIAALLAGVMMVGIAIIKQRKEEHAE